MSEKMKTKHMRIQIGVLFVMSCLLVASAVNGAEGEEPSPYISTELPTFAIGIVTDGPMEIRPNVVETFKGEISQMAEGEFKVKFPEGALVEADGTFDSIKMAIDRMLNDPGIDLVITLGSIGSTQALKLEDLAKPVIAPLIFDAELQKAPRDGLASGRPNLFYLNLGTPIDQELISFRRMVPFKRLAILVDERDIKAVPELTKFSKQLSFEHSIDIDLIGVGRSAAEAVAQIPAETKAVMTGPLWQLKPEEVKILAEKLIERKIAGFSMANFNYVEAGLLATTMPKNSFQQIARQIAISIQEILLGEDPATLAVSFSKGQKMAINMATARAINVYPSLDYMTGAQLLNEQRDDIERRITLPEVVAEALEANLDLAVAERQVLAGAYAVKEARSALLPQVLIGTGAVQIDDDRAAASRGVSPEKSWTGNIRATQQLYSEGSWAGYTVEKYLQSGREYGRDSVKLDIVFTASTVYLDVLRQKTVEQLQKDNMRLTQANLERAQIRLGTGVAGPDELYRWQTQFANDRQIVLRAESATRDAMQALNRVLNRPLREEFVAEETDLSDPLLIGGSRLFYDMIHNPLNFEKFSSYVLEQGIASSPELKAIDEAIAAQERLIVKARRDYWVPDISIDADLNYLFSNSGEGERIEEITGLDDTDWQVGVFARLPLVEGGRKGATLGRNREELIQLKTEKLATQELISQNILQALNTTRASYPSINLSRDAADAARRNLKLITDSYVQGIKSIIDLLDAQNQAINAELDAANAVYNFLIDLMALQRSMGAFVTFSSAEERDMWMKNLKGYLGVQ